MPYTANPVFSAPPNWDQGVLEKLAFKTDILTSEPGVEQRIARRLTPRRTFEASFYVQKENRQYMDNFLTANSAEVMVLPLWHQVTRLTSAAAIDDTSLVFDVAFREYTSGGLVFIRGPNPWTWEVLEITAVGSTGVSLASAVEKNWPAGTIIYPARLAVLDDRTQSAKKTDQFVEYRARFTVREQNIFSSASVDGAGIGGGPLGGYYTTGVTGAAKYSSLDEAVAAYVVAYNIESSPNYIFGITAHLSDVDIYVLTGSLHRVSHDDDIAFTTGSGGVYYHPCGAGMGWVAGMDACTLLGDIPAAPPPFPPSLDDTGSFIIQRPDDNEDLSFEQNRLMAIVDNEIGIPVRYDLAGKPFQKYTYRWAFKGRDKLHSLYALLYHLRGRQGTVLVPTFMSDFTIAQNISGSALTVKNVGYTDFGVLALGKDTLRIELRDGTVYYRIITGSEVTGDEEILALNTSLPDIVKEKVLQISYCYPCRLDQDEIEINHVTDSDGLTICVSTWQEATAPAV